MGLFQGVGVTITSALLVKMPAILTARGFDPIEAGTYTVWVGTLACLITAVVVFIFMKPGLKQQEQN